MNELCPMCKRHPAIIMTEKSTMIHNGITFTYDNTFYFCSTLGENDPDCYFTPSKVMDENVKRIREAYERKIRK